MVLGKLLVLGRPINFDNSRTRVYCACSGASGVVWTFFLSSIISLLLSPCLLETARNRLKYCLKGPLNTKQSSNHVFFCLLRLHFLLISYGKLPRCIQEIQQHTTFNQRHDVESALTHFWFKFVWPGPEVIKPFPCLAEHEILNAIS